MNQEELNHIDPAANSSQNLYRRPNKPKPKEVKPQQIIESATNEAGKVFDLSNKICVTSPWGEKAIAEITGFYQDDSGNTWVHYSPSESREGWQWEGGCIRAALLVKG